MKFQANAKHEEITAHQKLISSHCAGCRVRYLDAEVKCLILQAICCIIEGQVL